MILRRDPLRGLGLAELAAAYMLYRLGRVEGLRKLSYLLFLASSLDPETGSYSPLDTGYPFYLYIEGPMAGGLGGVVAGLARRGLLRVRVERFPGCMPSLADYIDFYDCKTLRILEATQQASKASQRLPRELVERIDAIADKYGSSTPSGLEKVLERLGAGLETRLRRIGSEYHGPREGDGGGIGGVIVEARSDSGRYSERLGGAAFLASTSPVPRLRSLADSLADAGLRRPLIQPLVAQGSEVKCFDMLWAGPRGCAAAEVLDASQGEGVAAGLRLCIERAAGGPCTGVVIVDCRFGGEPVCGVLNVVKAAPKGVLVLGYSGPEEAREAVESLSSLLAPVTGAPGAAAPGGRR